MVCNGKTNCPSKKGLFTNIVLKYYDVIVVRACAVGFFSELEVLLWIVNGHVCFEPFCHGVNQMFQAIMCANKHV